MSMSDELMILTVEKMQIELRRAMEDIELLTAELQRRIGSTEGTVATVEPVKTKRVIKIRKNATIEQVKKKPTGIVTWNAFLSQVRLEMQEGSEMKVKNEDVIAKATATKLADPEAYKTFCTNWLLAHPVV